MDKENDVPLVVNGGACVRSRLLLSSCDFCQQICPIDAIDLAGHEPEINMDVCVACGDCATACLEGVYSAPAPVLQAQTDAIFIPCRHNVGLNELVQMWQNGVRRLLVAVIHCQSCKEVELTQFKNVVTRFEQLTVSRGLPCIETVIANKQDIKDWQITYQRGGTPDPSRRAFLRRLVASVEPEVEPKTEEPLSAFLAQEYTVGLTSTLYPFSPHFDADLCVGCNDCISICPHEALTLIKAENGKSLYHCASEYCTGCHLCSDVCGVDAIKVHELEVRGADMLLTRFQCRACGVESHVTHDHPPADGLCRICQKTNHHKKLFLVLD